MNLYAVPTDEERKRAVGSAIRRAREARHFTGAELAKRTGKRAGTLSDIENGKSLPDLATLLSIADALDMSLDEVLERPKRAPATPATRLAALEGDVALLFERLESQARAILAILGALAALPQVPHPERERLQRLLDQLQNRMEAQ